VTSLPLGAHAHDALIVAGDVSDDLEVLERTLAELRSRFAHVFFCPGNHELWSETAASRRAHPPAANSLEKLDRLLQLCARLGVHTGPLRVGAGPGATPVLVVPLLSWHEEAFDTEPALSTLEVPRAQLVMKDFVACKWPPGLPAQDVARVLDARNEAEWQRAGCDVAAMVRAARGAGEPVVSFSHFLPRLELCPEKRFLFFPNLVKAVGSRWLGARVAALAPDLHVFGHTHFGCDATLDGVRYVQASLSYPQEREQRMSTIALGGADIGKGPVLLYESEGCGRFAPPYRCRWSEYYAANARLPLSTDIPHWVSSRYKAKAAAAAEQ